MPTTYCPSRSVSLRRASVEVRVGSVGVGGRNPIRIQSMTTSDTQDVAATVAQSVALAEAGCEIVRVTAPNVQAAACLREIRSRFSAAGFPHIPLVADIHFLPQAAMEAVEHVEKIRVNPGNYADKKKFAVRDYSDGDYGLELERLHEAFSPLVKRCRELGRSLRIGTNHGSLSDRIMNRFGDSPLGMVESALEFVRICEDNGFHDIILSMKASNPKVVIQAYRLLVSRMDASHRAYPLHLGVTEAGDGEDGRIKSAIGIGGLLLDGIGDTIRVSLTEDSVHEIPVAQALAAKAMSLWVPVAGAAAGPDTIDPFAYTRRPVPELGLGARIPCGALNPPRVIVPAPSGPALRETLADLRSPKLADTPPEGVLVRITEASELVDLPDFNPTVPVLELAPEISPEALATPVKSLPRGSLLCRRFDARESVLLASFLRLTRARGLILAADLSPAACRGLADTLQALGSEGLVVTLSDFRRDSDVTPASHALGAYRELAEALRACKCAAPLWIRSTTANSIAPAPGLLSLLLEASILGGGLLADGLGDLLSIETETDTLRSLRLCYNVLQGAGSRISKTEYVACPSCGRTLFDLQSTTRRIREKTGHLKGVKLAIMGCIVNGPGEMADADFGYVGGAPGKINLYVGKDCVQYNLPAEEADARLISLIKERGRWQEPPPPSA